jgi:hypothetical protein
MIERPIVRRIRERLAARRASLLRQALKKSIR